MEASAIGAILLLNAVIGFVQEYRAETAVQALSQLTSPRATVLRNGQKVLIFAKEVVTGDLLILEPGDLVAADAKLIEVNQLQINEAILTGESLPVEKRLEQEAEIQVLSERVGSIFMGTTVVLGTASAEVTATGMSTELGKIAHLITTAESDPTPLQVQLRGLGRTLLFACLGIVALVSFWGFLQGRSWLELIIFSISLAVAAVPEGMPAIVTVALALGIQRMALRNALIRRLPSVETLGSVSVICTDKTGTLTTGNMRVRELWGENHDELLEAAISCCDAELYSDGLSGTGDPTELAILISGHERGIEKDQIEKINPRLMTSPFDSNRKRMSVFRKDGCLYVKGALESLLPLCSKSTDELERAERSHSEFTSRALRVIAVAKGESNKEENLTFLGLIGMADPPRTEVSDAIREAKSAGILPIMITGDHPSTAQAIAKELGLAVNGDEAKNLVHARATPEDKLKLVRSWKSKGKIVAMTGDGVNDAPALREAHIGIAMGKSGTEVTRQAADLILADDNFATIVAAVKEGRGVYQNIRKAIVYLLTGNFAELMVVFGALAMGLPLPFLAVHLLWINLVTDSLPGLALIADPVSPDVMKHHPRKTNESILGRKEWVQILVAGLLEALVMLILFLITFENAGIEEARNFVFTTMVFSQLFRSFGARSRTRIFWQVGALNNLWLLGVVVLTGCLQLSLHYLPFTQNIFGLMPLVVDDILFAVLLALIPISLIEAKKLIIKAIPTEALD